MNAFIRTNPVMFMQRHIISDLFKCMFREIGMSLESHEFESQNLNKLEHHNIRYEA